MCMTLSRAQSAATPCVGPAARAACTPQTAKHSFPPRSALHACTALNVCTFSVTVLQALMLVFCLIGKVCLLTTSCIAMACSLSASQGASGPIHLTRARRQCSQGTLSRITSQSRTHQSSPAPCHRPLAALGLPASYLTATPTSPEQGKKRSMRRTSDALGTGTIKKMRA